MRKLIKYLFVILILSQLFSGCKRKCPPDPTYLTCEINNVEYRAHGRKNCSWIPFAGGYTYNASGVFTDDYKYFSIDRSLYAENSDESKDLLMRLISHHDPLRIDTVYYFYVPYSLSHLLIDDYETRDMSGWVKLLSIEKMENGKGYNIKGIFEAILVNSARNDTLYVTNGKFNVFTY